MSKETRAASHAIHNLLDSQQPPAVAVESQALWSAPHYYQNDQSLFSKLLCSVDAANSEPQAHRQAFMTWLVLDLEQQLFHLHQFLADQENPTALLEQWAHQRWHERLIPAGVIGTERQLFLADFQIVATLAYSDLQPAHANPDLVFALTLSFESQPKNCLA